MARPKEVLGEEMEQALFTCIEQKIMSLPAVEAEVMREQVEDYLNSNCRTKSAQRKMITLSLMECLLAITKIPACDVYAAMGVELEWPTQRAQDFAHKLDAYPEEEKRRVELLVRDLSPVFWQGRFQELDSPTKRLRFVMNRQHGRKVKSRMDAVDALGEEFVRVWKDHKENTTVKLSQLPLYSKQLEVSLHWLLGIKNDATVLAADAVTETCVTGYLFLNDFGRTIVDAFIRNLERGV